MNLSGAHITKQTLTIFLFSSIQAQPHDSVSNPLYQDPYQKLAPEGFMDGDDKTGLIN